MLRLWFELTSLLEKLFKEPQAASLILPIYKQIVMPLQKRISPDAFVRFSVQAAAQLGSPQEAIPMLLSLSEQFKSDAKQTHLYVYARITAAYYQLGMNDLAGAKEAIDECLPLVEAFVGVDAAIRAAFYKVRSEFDKVKALFSEYYRDAFLHLACVSLEELGGEARVAQAHDLCVAALLGETVYNFGELLMHPILESLSGHPKLGYLVATLSAFNAGDHAQLETLLPALSTNPVLAPRIDFLRQKMCLMALVEGVFKALKTSRRIPFAMVAEVARVPLAEVEFLLMKALSLGLLKGSIDEIEQSMTVEWVQPRVLDRRQLAELRAAIQAWKARIADISKSLDIVNSLPAVMEES